MILRDWISFYSFEEKEIFDTFQFFQEGHIFVLSPPKNMDQNEYKKKLEFSVNKKNPAAFICIGETKHLVDHPIKIAIGIEELYNYIEERYYSSPSKLIGVTGSYGKSSTCFLLFKILRKLGKTAYISCSIGNGKEEPLEKNFFTTPSWITLKRNLHINSSCEFGIIECSSQGIAGLRLRNIFFVASIFTGYVLDHIDSHLSEEKYINAKLALFDKNVAGLRIINSEIDERIKSRIESPIFFPSSEYFFSFLNPSIFFIGSQKIECFVSKIQSSNLLGALTTLHLLGLELPKELEIGKIEGRDIFIGKTIYGAEVYIDGAHGPEKINKFLSISSSRDPGNLIVLGIDGARIKNDVKSGYIAEQYGTLILTDDNPKNLDPDHIRQLVKEKCRNPCIEIADRIEAIKYALISGRKRIYILGKSTEADCFIRYKDIYIPYNEEQVVRSILEQINNKEI